MKEDERTYDDIAEFLEGLTMGNPKEAHQGGVTWLELYVSAELQGVRMDKHDNVYQKGNRCQAKPSVEQNLNRFIKATKKIAGYALSDDQMEYFKGGKVKSERLKELGIQYHQKAIAGMPSWDFDHAERIAQHMLMLRTNVNENMKKRLPRGVSSSQSTSPELKGHHHGEWQQRHRWGKEKYGQNISYMI